MLEKPTISKTQFPIESLLSARLLLEPQIVGDRIYFLSDLAGTLSLYSIASSGSIPEPLLPGGLALVNPHIMPGDNFHVLPKLGKVLVMIDKLGDENYQPNLIPLGGGIPEPLFGNKYRDEQIACVHCDKEKNIAYFFRDNRKTPDIECLMVNLEKGDVFVLEYNIDGASWAYEGRFHSGTPPTFEVERVLIGNQPLSDGVVLGLEWQIKNEKPLQAEYVFSFTRANSPSQIYHIPIGEKVAAERLSSEKVLGIPDEYLSAGEDASYTSFDGLRVSARLYLPSSKLGYKGPRPLVEYVHGGPQGQERPDFTWFSMPLIQYLTLNGFAVFVPNVRGSTGYGMRYMKWVDKDWGGKDVLDHVEGLKGLEKDPRIDSQHRGVVGRSYGGYMTLTLASRHPELWKAAVDMFGPYDLPTWVSRIPPTWQTYFRLSLGDPIKDKDFLVERSPKTYMNQLSCPLMIIQGKHDPRVPEPESSQLVDDLRKGGVTVAYQVYEDEGHDVLRFMNRVHCYNTITEFFRKNLSN